MSATWGRLLIACSLFPSAVRFHRAALLLAQAAALGRPGCDGIRSAQSQPMTSAIAAISATLNGERPWIFRRRVVRAMPARVATADEVSPDRAIAAATRVAVSAVTRFVSIRTR